MNGSSFPTAQVRASIVPAVADAEAREVALALQLIRQIGANLVVRPTGDGGGEADASLTEQLHALYAEREQLETQLGVSDPARVIERIRGLEAQVASVQASLASLGEHLGGGDIVEFVMQTEATVASLTDQLASLYADNEARGPDGQIWVKAPEVEVETNNFEEQLASLYADRDVLTNAFGTADAVELAGVVLAREKTLVDEIAALKAEQKGVASATSVEDRATIESLGEQLHALYAEREELTREIGLEEPLSAIRGQEATIESLGMQLHTLYADREALTREIGDADPAKIIRSQKAAVESLDAKLKALAAEREELFRASGGVDPQQAIREHMATIETLNAKLASIAAEREELTREIGSDGPASVIRRDRATIESMGAQLAVLYADRERSDTAPSAAAEYDKTIKNLVEQLESLYHEREHAVAEPKRSPLDEIRSRFLGS
jgi:hypothetical protein